MERRNLHNLFNEYFMAGFVREATTLDSFDLQGN